MSKKRSFIESISKTSIPTNNSPMKKQKLNPNPFPIKSILFVNESDHSQFIQIFKSIDNSQLSNKLQITHAINKEIAEYSTGQFVTCNNSNCLNKSPRLFQ
eukprot:51839_1